MSRLHSTLIALVIGLAAAAGLVAVVQTVRLGQTAAAVRPATVPARRIAMRRAKLAHWSQSLHKALAKRPPALPKLPHYKPVTIPTVPAAAAPVAAAAPSSAAAPSVTYVKPPTVVKYKHAAASKTTTSTSSSYSDDDGSSGSGGGSDDGGGDN